MQLVDEAGQVFAPDLPFRIKMGLQPKPRAPEYFFAAIGEQS